MVPASEVLVGNAIVGFADVLQQTPRYIIVLPPSLVTFPPLVAVVCVIEDTAVVVSVGTVPVVVKLISFP